MTSPEPRPGITSNPILGVAIGLCGVGLLAAAVGVEWLQKRDWWAFVVDVILGLAAISFAIDVVVLAPRRKR